VTEDELIAEGEALVKRCFVLSARGAGAVAGYWGGERADEPNALPPEVTRFKGRRHIVSVGEPLLAAIGLARTSWVSVFEYLPRDDDEPDYRAFADDEPAWGALEFSGEPLYATEHRSFPPLEALCLHGSARVGDWLASLGLARHQYWKVPRELTKSYVQHYVRSLLEQEKQADVIVGGWHQLWPEDRYYVPQELLYVLKTLRDAEPWLTLWHSPMMRGNFVRSHVS
jgi:hypothetical protein